MVNYRSLTFDVIDNITGSLNLFSEEVKSAIDNYSVANPGKRIVNIQFGNVYFDLESNSFGASIIVFGSTEMTDGRAAVNVSSNPFFGVGKSEEEANISLDENMSHNVSTASIINPSRIRVYDDKKNVLVALMFIEEA